MKKDKYEIRIREADCDGNVHWLIAKFVNNPINCGWFSSGKAGISKTIVGASVAAIRAYRELPK